MIKMEDNKTTRLLKREMEHKILGAIREFEIASGLYVKDIDMYCSDSSMTTIDVNAVLV